MWQFRREVLHRRETQALDGGRAEHVGEVELGRVGGVAGLHDLHAPGHALEVLEGPPQPGHLGPHELQVGVALEDAADDQVAHGEAGPQLEVDEHHRHGRVGVGGPVGAARALVLVDREAGVDEQPPRGGRSCGGSRAGRRGWAAPPGASRRPRPAARPPSAPRRWRRRCRSGAAGRRPGGGRGAPGRTRRSTGCGPGARPTAARTRPAPGGGRPGGS